MSDNSSDPSANTEQFRAFVSSDTDEPAPAKLALMIGAVVVGIALVALVAFLALR